MASDAGKIFGGFVILAITAGLAFLTIQGYKLYNLCYKFAGYNFIGFFKNGSATNNPFGADSAKLTLTMKLTNPSSLTVSLAGYNFDVFINNMHVSNINSTTPCVLEAKENTVINIPVSIDMKGSTALIKNQALIGYLATKQLDKILITLQGKVLVLHLYGEKYISKSLTMEMTLADIQADI